VSGPSIILFPQVGQSQRATYIAIQLLGKVYDSNLRVDADHADGYDKKCQKA
jgi:hypothetical protein